MNGMDQRVFGPYFGTPPEQQTEDSFYVRMYQQPVQTERLTLRQRLAGRRRKPRTTRP
jgi:hypothetical protein